MKLKYLIGYVKFTVHSSNVNALVDTYITIYIIHRSTPPVGLNVPSMYRFVYTALCSLDVRCFFFQISIRRIFNIADDGHTMVIEFIMDRLHTSILLFHLGEWKLGSLSTMHVGGFTHT